MIPKVEDAPQKVLNTIGQNLVKEIRPTVRKKSGRLRKSLGYWARREEKDLQIGFKIFYAPFVVDRTGDPIKPVVEKNIKYIGELIGQALDAIRKGTG